MTTVNDELLAHSRLVLPDRIIAQGWVAMSGGKIAEIGEGEAPERGLDMSGDLPIPGLMELHTDHIEAHFLPRPGVIWHPLGRAFIRRTDRGLGHHHRVRLLSRWLGRA